MATSPLSASRRCARISSRVDLPEPFGRGRRDPLLECSAIRFEIRTRRHTIWPGLGCSAGAPQEGLASGYQPRTSVPNSSAGPLFGLDKVYGALLETTRSREA